LSYTFFKAADQPSAQDAPAKVGAAEPATKPAVN